jgi:dTDP-glucose pyrophosphorylase/CBS domain-containing protein
VTAAELEPLLVSEDAPIQKALACIDATTRAIALVVADDRRLIGTVTDGDIRRAMLAHVDLSSPVKLLLERQRELGEERPFPLTAARGAPSSELIALMQRYEVRQIPIVDDDGQVVDLAVLGELIEAGGPPLRAVVMAGGYGSRLGELTAETPKPMLPVGDRPLLERIVAQLRDAGITHVNLTTHFRADAILEHFGDGRAFGVEIEYVSEDRPLGTAGALGLVRSDGPLLVMNGDIVTDVDFRSMHRFHDEHAADMTVALRPYEVRVPYGVVELSGADVEGIVEKPLLRGFVNAGIYLVGGDVAASVAPGEALEMPELIERLVREGRRVVGFPLREYWLDIGQPVDYEQALADVEGTT